MFLYKRIQHDIHIQATVYIYKIICVLIIANINICVYYVLYVLYFADSLQLFCLCIVFILFLIVLFMSHLL